MLTHVSLTLTYGSAQLLAHAGMRSFEPKSQLLVEMCAALLVLLPCASLTVTVFIALCCRDGRRPSAGSNINSPLGPAG